MVSSKTIMDAFVFLDARIAGGSIASSKPQDLAKEVGQPRNTSGWLSKGLVLTRKHIRLSERDLMP